MTASKMERLFEAMSDDELYVVLGDQRSTYTPEAIAVAERIAQIRGVDSGGIPALTAGTKDAGTTENHDEQYGQGSDFIETAYDLVTNALVIMIWSVFVAALVGALLPDDIQLGPIGDLWALLFLILRWLVRWAAIPLVIAWVSLRIVRSERAIGSDATRRVP